MAADNQDEPIEIFEDLEDDKPVFSLGKDVSDRDIFQLAKKNSYLVRNLIHYRGNSENFL